MAAAGTKPGSDAGPPPAGSATPARLQIMAAAALFSTGGAAIKATSLTGPQMACARSAVAGLAVALLMPEARRGWSRGTVGVGAAYAATMILFVWSNKLTTAASSIFLQSTAPLFILMLGPWLLREPVRRADLLLTAALAVAMVLLFAGMEPPQRSAPDPAAGNLMALASGACYAVTVIGMRWTARREMDGSAPPGSSAAVVLSGNVLAAAACLPAAWPMDGAGAADGLVVVYLGVFQIALAYVLLTRGMRSVPALEASLLLLVEPVLNPVWAWLAQGEIPGPWTIAGGAIILAATTLRTWSDARRT
ncbi:MAG TPA: DMT family transporter [Candidatus Polarisedimenticolia bacterium]|nr:DMT family transporter [Candidatus Polarisedimenticolia bacterium]